MPKKYILLSVVALGGLFRTPALPAQDAVGEQELNEAPRIFFDCQGSSCDRTYYRTEIPWVTWVRDQQDSDLHVIMTSQTTGATDYWCAIPDSAKLPRRHRNRSECCAPRRLF